MLDPLRQLLAADDLCALTNLGKLYLNSNRPDAAIPPLRRATELYPQTFLAWNYRGDAELAMRRPAEAVQAYLKATALRPDDPDVMGNLTIACWQAQLIEAMRRVAERNRDAMPKHYALASLLAGDYRTGFEWYEHRNTPLDLPGQVDPDLRWDGNPCGLTVIDDDQGFGDTILFARFLHRLSDTVQRITFVGRKPLARLFRHSFPAIEFVEAKDYAPAGEMWESLYSLPHRLEVTADSVPGEPYLSADPELIEHWKKRMERYPRPWIVVQLRGNPGHPFDHLRSIPERLMREWLLTGVPRHGGNPSAQCDFAAGEHRTRVRPGTKFDVSTDMGTINNCAKLEVRDFADLAAILACADQIVSVDTALINLAGAMGLPAILLNSFATDFRWGYGDRSVWYPSIRILRQTIFDDWGSAISQLHC
jgi:tetratricopeptide (TPR) repeat protein